MTRIRGDNGKFVQKSQEPRSVKSIRVTDSAWETLGHIADQQCITRGDLIEYFAISHVLHEDLEKDNDRLKGEIAALRLQLSDMEGRLSSFSSGDSQQLDIFSDIKQIDRDHLHRLRDQVLSRRPPFAKQSKYYKDMVTMFNKFIDLLLKEL
jgi:hypothetical protein